MKKFCAHFLLVLAAWTLTIKWVLPVIWAIAQNAPVTTYIFWDFWWVIHIWLALCLLRETRYQFAFSVTVSVIEIAIIVTKFILFLPQGDWTLWTMNWFVNKIFVLSCFVILLSHALARKDLYKSNG